MTARANRCRAVIMAMCDCPSMTSSYLDSTHAGGRRILDVPDIADRSAAHRWMCSRCNISLSTWSSSSSLKIDFQSSLMIFSRP